MGSNGSSAQACHAWGADILLAVLIMMTVSVELLNGRGASVPWCLHAPCQTRVVYACAWALLPCRSSHCVRRSMHHARRVARRIVLAGAVCWGTNASAYIMR